ncbi:MAG: tetratricopeptide repeat protein [Pyrinomonadaceae bacterium]|nr:tetratricopeptide repeat protein [Pyrinomonadaceae bacterium]
MIDILKTLLEKLGSLIGSSLTKGQTITVLVLLIIAGGLFLIPHNKIPTVQLIWPGLFVLLAIGFILISIIPRWWIVTIVIALFVGWSSWCYFTYTKVPRQIRQLMTTAALIKKDNNYNGSFAKYQEAYNLAKENDLLVEQLACLREMSELKYLTSEYTEARNFLNEGLGVAERLKDQSALGHVRSRLGDVERFSGNIPLASEHFKAALAIYEKLGNKRGQAQAYRGLADLELKRDGVKARENYNKALKLAQEVKNQLGGADIDELIENELGEADTLAGLGDLEGRVGNTTQALDYYNRALAIYKRRGSTEGQGDVYRGLGDLERYLNKLDEADTDYQQALGLYQFIGDLGGQADAYRGLGELGSVQVKEDKINEGIAKQYFKQALELYEKIKEQNGQAEIYNLLGELDSALSAEAAQKNYETALNIYKSIQNLDGQADTLKDIGDLDVKAGKHDSARGRYETALGFYKKVGNQIGQAEVHKSLGDLSRTTEDFEAASQHYNDALLIYQNMNNQNGVAQINIVLGDLASLASAKEPPQNKKTKIDEARNSYTRALEAYNKSDNKLGQTVALQGISNVDAKQKNLAESKQNLSEAEKIYLTMYGDQSKNVAVRNTVDPNNPVRQERIQRLVAF